MRSTLGVIRQLSFTMAGLVVALASGAAAPAFVGPHTFALKWGTNGTGNGEFNLPTHAVVDSLGNIYVADHTNFRIQKFNSSGTYITQWGSEGTGDGEFERPAGLAIDSNDNLYVTDFQGDHVQKFTTAGAFIRKWGSSGSGDGEFDDAIGIAVDSSDNVYVVSRGSNRVQKFDSDGTFLLAWGGSGSGAGTFNSPYFVAIDSNDQVYVTDSGNKRIQVFDTNGTFLRAWGSDGTGDGQFKGLAGIAIGPDNTVYTTDLTRHCVQIFSSTGTFLSKFGSNGTGDGQLAVPYGIFTYPSQRVIVADAGNNRIQVFDRSVLGASTNVTMDEDGAPQAFSLRLFAADADGDTITWTISDPASDGAASVSGTGVFKDIAYVPDADFNGTDSFDVQIADGNGGTDIITVNVTVNAQPDAPVIAQTGPLSVTMDEDGAPTPFVAPTVSATDGDGDVLTWSVLSQGSRGTATVSGTGASPTTFTYAPHLNENGMDSFVIQVEDGTGLSDTITVNVTINSINDAPILSETGSITIVMDEDGVPVGFNPLSLFAFDADNDTLTWSVSTPASNGTATVSGTGPSLLTYTYVPFPDFNGMDSFVIQVTDGNGGTDTVTVNVTINPINDAPVIAQANPLSVIMDEDGSPTAFVAPTLTATDVDGDLLVWAVLTAPEHGVADVSGAGMSPSTFTYEPNPNFSGSDSFEIVVADGNGGVDPESPPGSR